MNKIKGQHICNLLYCIIGTFLIALGINVFFMPFNIISGGMNGVSILLYRLFHIAPDVTLFIANFPLLLLSLLLLGKGYTIKTVICAFLLPVFVRLTHMIAPYTDNALLAAIFGGVVTGAGIGLVFKGGSSTGGTAIVEQIIHEYFKIPLGASVILIDGLILLLSFFFFDVSTGFYSIISLAIIGKMVDYIQRCGITSKTCFIVSSKSDAIIYSLTTDYNLGVTLVQSKGSNLNEESEIVICTCKQKSLSLVKAIVVDLDNQAFCLIFDTKEVVGNRR